MNTRRQARWLGAGLVAVAAAAGLAPAAAQETVQDAAGALAPRRLALADGTGWRGLPGGWRVAGSVAADRTRENDLRAGDGTGILVNLPGRSGGANLFSDWEHGDLELELEFLMARGSNAGVYLQGRYEVQLFDSWGVQHPTFADAGGIYQRWDEARGARREGFEGVAPRVNASRAPGLWQTMRIVFRAPRFDAAGRKTENARFVRVEHNGVVVHENVDVTGPTRAAAFGDERAMGPLMIQGDHGPVALRNVRFRRYSGGQVRPGDLRFRAWSGQFTELAAATAGEPVREGTADGIGGSLGGSQDQWAVEWRGTLTTPAAGPHRFDIQLGWVTPDPGFAGRVVGGARLEVAGRPVLVHDGLRPAAEGTVELPAGTHPFTLVVFKNRPWTDNSGILLHVEGPGLQRHALHQTAGNVLSPPDPIVVGLATEPQVLRSFVRHGDSILTHAASVGDPGGVHFGYDLDRGALIHAWRGPFVDATEMWHDRGERQLAVPLGSVLPLANAPAVARLAGEDAAWPAAPGAEYRFGGYAMDDDGRPVFQYRLGEVQVEDRIRPEEGALRRELTVRAPAGTAGLYVRVAEGAAVTRLPDGSYAVGDRAYYVAPERGARPVVRNSAGRQELLIPVTLRGGEARVAYSLIW